MAQKVIKKLHEAFWQTWASAFHFGIIEVVYYSLLAIFLSLFTGLIFLMTFLSSSNEDNQNTGQILLALLRNTGGFVPFLLLSLFFKGLWFHKVRKNTYKQNLFSNSLPLHSVTTVRFCRFSSECTIPVMHFLSPCF